MFTLRLYVGVKFRGIDTLMSLAPALQYFGHMYPFVNRKKFRNVTQDDLYHNECIIQHYSWFAINLSGYGEQCQPPTPAGSDNGINNIFLCVVPPTWPP